MSQTGPLCFLNRQSLGVARSDASLRLGQWFMFNGRNTKNKENLLLNHKVQSTPCCFLKFSERGHGGAVSRLRPRLAQWFVSKGIRHMD